MLLSLGLSLVALKVGAATFDDYYPLVVGTTWTYRATISLPNGPFTTTYTQTVTDLGSGTIGVRQDGDGYTTVTRCVRYQGLTAVAEVTGSGVHTVYNPPCIVGVRDLTPGYKETVTCSGTSNGQPFTGPTETTTVIGYEDVTVPAGWFQKALKIEGDIQQGSARSVVFSWLAKGVGLVRSTDSSGETVLIAYGIGPAQETPTAVPVPTGTATRTPTPVIQATTVKPTFTGTATPTPTPMPCVGDCNGDGQVTVDEIIMLVNVALGTAAPSACPNGIASGADVDVALILRAVNNALNGCPTQTAIWKSGGPEDGAVYGFSIDPRNPDIVYAATGTGMFRSIDGG